MSLQVVLPTHLDNVRDKLAENIHELWGMNKIELGWTYGKVQPSSCWHGDEHSYSKTGRADFMLMKVQRWDLCVSLEMMDKVGLKRLLGI